MMRGWIRKCFFPAAVVFSAALYYPGPCGAFTLKVVPQFDYLRTVREMKNFHLVPSPERSGSPETRERSFVRAGLYSFLLPGLGQLWIGEKNRAIAFFLAEGAIWSSLIAFEVQGRLREDSYKRYAVAYAGLSFSNHSDDFYRIIGQFRSSQEYKASLKREGRYEIDYANYAELEHYFRSNRVSDYEPWIWLSEENRLHYHDLRRGSNQAYRRALYSLAVAVVNRAISAVFAMKSARDTSRSGSAQANILHIRILSGHDGTPRGFRFGVSLAHAF